MKIRFNIKPSGNNRSRISNDWPISNRSGEKRRLNVRTQESQRGEGFVNELSGQFRLRVPSRTRTSSNNYWVKIRGPGAISRLTDLGHSGTTASASAADR